MITVVMWPAYALLMGAIGVACWLPIVTYVGRHGHGPAYATADFTAPVPPAVFLAMISTFAAQQPRWRVVQPATEMQEVRVRCRITMKTYTKSVRITAQPNLAGGSRVHVLSSSPQFCDWGDNARLVRYLEQIWARPQQPSPI
jgi:hypothetical protein